jgi:hypothetical protein
MDEKLNKHDLFKLFPLINDSINTIFSLHSLSTQLSDLITNETTRTFHINDIMCMDTSDFTNLKLKLSSNIQ